MEMKRISRLTVRVGAVVLVAVIAAAGRALLGRRRCGVVNLLVTAVLLLQVWEKKRLMYGGKSTDDVAVIFDFLYDVFADDTGAFRLAELPF